MSEQKLPDIVERLRAEATTIEYQVRGQDPGDWKEIGLMREAASQIERLRASSIGWEEAIEAAAKVADETAALEDKHDRYEAYRAAHDIAQTIRSLLPSIAAPPNAPMPPWWVVPCETDEGRVYEIWGGNPKRPIWMFSFFERRFSNAKELADLIVQRTKQ